MVSIKCFSLVACFLMADVFYGFVGGAALREGACRLMMLVRPMSPFCFGEACGVASRGVQDSE